MADSIHFSVQVISRASGRSATAAAAYRSGTRIADERTGVVHDYRRKGGVVFSEVLLPSHAPSDFSDRSTLWNAVEQSEKGKNAQVCREIVAALPRELSRGENIAFARDYIRRTFVDAGMVADWAYHDPDGKNENPHIHVMLTMREVGEDGAFSPKAHKEYLCRIAGRKGSERYMTPAELKAAKDGWEKVFKYRKGNERREPHADRSRGLEGLQKGSQGRDRPQGRNQRLERPRQRREVARSLRLDAEPSPRPRGPGEARGPSLLRTPRRRAGAAGPPGPGGPCDGAPRRRDRRRREESGHRRA